MYTASIEWPKTIIIFISLNQYFSFLASIVDPDQPASEEASWSRSTQFAMQLTLLFLHSWYKSYLFSLAKTSKLWQFLLDFWRKLLAFSTGPRSAVGNVSGYRCVSDCRSRGREFDPSPVPYFRGDWSWNNFYGHSPPFRWFIQEGLLSVTSESMCTKYWLTACSSLPRKKCG